MIAEAVYRASLALGERFAGVKLSACEPVVRPDGRFWRKRRRPWAGVVVATGNATLAAFGVPQRMLATDVWIEREVETYAAAYGRRAERVAADTVLLPALPGVTLATVLASREVRDDEKRAAIVAAAQALAVLHRLVACPAPSAFSHGDATTSNVLWDRQSGRAAWIDFDLTHDAGLPEQVRHANDLQTLAYSAAARLGVDGHALIATALACGYDDAAVLAEVGRGFRVESGPLLPLWVSQAPPTLGQLRSLEAALAAQWEHAR